MMKAHGPTRAIAAFAILLPLVFTSCDSNDREYNGEVNTGARHDQGGSLVGKLDLNPYQVAGITVLAATEPRLEGRNSENTAKIIQEQYKTEISEDRSALDYAWGVVITHTKFETQKYKDIESLKALVEAKKDDLKSRGGSSHSKFRSGSYKCGSIEGVSLDFESSVSGIGASHSSVTFTKDNHLWEVQIIGVIVSENPDSEAFEQLKDEIFGSIRITSEE